MVVLRGSVCLSVHVRCVAVCTPCNCVVVLGRALRRVSGPLISRSLQRPSNVLLVPCFVVVFRHPLLCPCARHSRRHRPRRGTHTDSHMQINAGTCVLLFSVLVGSTTLLVSVAPARRHVFSLTGMFASGHAVVLIDGEMDTLPTQTRFVTMPS